MAQFIAQFCRVGSDYIISDAGYRLLCQHLQDEMHIDSLKVGSVQTGAIRNDPNHIMVLHFGKYVNKEGKLMQALYRPTNVVNAIKKFNALENVSLKLMLVDGPYEGETAVQSVPPETKSFENHDWYEYIRSNLCFEWSASTSSAQAKVAADRAAVADAAFVAAAAEASENGGGADVDDDEDEDSDEDEDEDNDAGVPSAAPSVGGKRVAPDEASEPPAKVQRTSEAFLQQMMDMLGQRMADLQQQHEQQRQDAVAEKSQLQDMLNQQRQDAAAENAQLNQQLQEAVVEKIHLENKLNAATEHGMQLQTRNRELELMNVELVQNITRITISNGELMAKHASQSCIIAKLNTEKDALIKVLMQRATQATPQQPAPGVFVFNLQFIQKEMEMGGFVQHLVDACRHVKQKYVESTGIQPVYQQEPSSNQGWAYPLNMMDTVKGWTREFYAGR